MNDLALHADSLTRTFPVRRSPDRSALDSVDLELPVGAVHGLLGPNGAGKTTLCRIACTVLTPTSGHLSILGHDVTHDADDVRRLIGVVFGGDRGLYGRLTARENLQFWCAMNGVPRRHTRERVDVLLERLGLAGRATELVETFSRGMKQRLHLARGLIADPPMLLLDEPTVGMDPVSAHEFRTLIAELSGDGRTVLLTTHDMGEAQSLCDTVTFIDGGRIAGTGTPETVREMRLEGGTRVRVHELALHEHESLLAALPSEVVGTYDERARHADLIVTPAQMPHVVATVMAQGHPSITTGPPGLEDVYLALFGRRDGGDRGMAV